MSDQIFPNTFPKKTISEVLTRDMFSPPWTKQDREAVKYIATLSDRALTDALISDDPKLEIRSECGKFVNPVILSYIRINRYNAWIIYEASFKFQ